MDGTWSFIAFLISIFTFASADMCQNITMESHNLRTNIIKCYSGNTNILAQIKIKPIVDERYNFTNDVNFIFRASNFYFMTKEITNMTLVNFDFRVINSTDTQLFFNFSDQSNMTINVKTISITPPDEFFERTYSAGLKFDVLLKQNKTDECPKPKCILLIIDRENEFNNDLKYHLHINNSDSWKTSACASLYPGERNVIPLTKSNFDVFSTSIVFEFALACKSVYDTTCQYEYTEICSKEDLRKWNVHKPTCTTTTLSSDYYPPPNNTGSIIMLAFIICMLVVVLIYSIAKMIVKWKQNHRSEIEVPLTE
uniref:Uncharacterized protein n=1 Tax=Marseillevirus LCMAC102 TaxID=2506603 RepID=A0A481YT99_9VIRU|nr:MAG: hypothetical protein LCMAC102_00140 [Marseillevirus LCMAC102]